MQFRRCSFDKLAVDIPLLLTVGIDHRWPICAMLSAIEKPRPATTGVDRGWSIGAVQLSTDRLPIFVNPNTRLVEVESATPVAHHLTRQQHCGIVNHSCLRAIFAFSWDQ